MTDEHGMGALVWCSAGRELVRAGDPEWEEPCKNNATGVLVVVPDSTMPVGKRIPLCTHHGEVLDKMGMTFQPSSMN